MLTVRASKKRRFFLRRDVLLIRRRTQRRPRAAGTQSAHILLARSKKKIPSNETRVSSCLFYLRVVVSLRAYLLSADNNDDRFFYRLVLCFSLVFSRKVGFSLAENHRPRSLRSIFSFFLLGFLVKQRDALSLGGQTTTKKKADERRIETTFATLNNRIFFFSVLSPSFYYRPFLSLRYVNNTTECAESVCILNTSQRPFVSRRRRRRRERRSAE